MAVSSDVDAAELRRRVTSPNGTTEAAIKSFQADGFEALVEKHSAPPRTARPKWPNNWANKEPYMIGLNTAAVYVLQTLGSLYLLIVLLRFVLQLVRANFYNPLCQFVVKATQPLLKPLRRIIPSLLAWICHRWCWQFWCNWP